MYNCLKFSILAPLFLSCREDNEPHLIWLMIFSDAQPVQFWLIDCNTFNQNESEGVFHRCFCQPWQCDDPIKIQFTDDTPSEITEVITLPALSTWLSTNDVGPTWNTGSAPDVTVDGEESEILYTDYDFIEGRIYEITVDYTKVYNSGSSNPRTIRVLLMDDSFTELDFDSASTPSSPGGSSSIVATFTAPEDATKLGIKISDGSNVTLTVDDVTGTRTTGSSFVLSVRDESGDELMQLPFEMFDNGNTFVYNLELIPSESSPDLCDQKIQFVVINETSGTTVAQSDCQDIRTSQPDTILATYRNHRNIYGLVYADISPELEFYIRIPAIFYHQRFPKEEEVMSLSTSIVSLNSVVRKQRLMDIDYVPYYFHEKLQLVLSHQFVTIYNREWVSDEAYEIAEGNRMYPVKKSQIWLSEKDFVQRNVL